MSIKEGEILDNWMQKERISAYDLAKKLDVAPQTIYYHIGKEKISDSFKHKLLTNGFDIFNTNITTESENKKAPEVDAEFDEIIKEQIKTLRVNLATLEALLQKRKS